MEKSSLPTGSLPWQSTATKSDWSFPFSRLESDPEFINERHLCLLMGSPAIRSAIFGIAWFAERNGLGSGQIGLLSPAQIGKIAR